MPNPNTRLVWAERELPLSEAEERGGGRAMARGRGAVGRVRVTKKTQTHGLHFKDRGQPDEQWL